MDARLEGAIGFTIETDVCIVGAGPAGLSLGHRLAAAGVDVALLESGDGSAFPPDPLDGEVAGRDFESLAASRRRGLGGSALLWNSRLHRWPAARYVPLEPIDFEARAWVADSGWPIGWADLAPYYQQADALAGLNPADPPVPELPPLTDAIGPGWYRVGLASVFYAKLPAALARHPRVHLRPGATVTRLEFAPDRSRVVALQWAGRAGAHGVVRAQRFVLAMGAIENARYLLLAGLEGAWMGRGFMEHPRDWTLRLTQPTRALARVEGFFGLAPEGPACARWGRLALREATMRTEQLMGGSATLYPLPGESVPLRRPFRWLLDRPRALAYGVTINLEQAPDRANRVTLSHRHDAFGLPLPSLDWRWNAADEASRVRLRGLVREALESAGFGRVVETDQPHPDPNAHHHAGTTRMSRDAHDGVVNEHSRVHGVENLFVTGGSVLPTAGFANPTHTIIALALRLADHLAPGVPAK